jgi:N-acetyltransferase 10
MPIQMSEVFLQRLMSLFVSSHYKVIRSCTVAAFLFADHFSSLTQNSPNDLQLMSDAPAHMLFVLLGPVSPTSSDIPDILCAVQVCNAAKTRLAILV